LVHNHPSSDPSPSQADIKKTKAIIDIAARSGLRPHHRRQGRAREHEGDAI
jgi:DNA repair protein RadC